MHILALNNSTLEYIPNKSNCLYVSKNYVQEYSKQDYSQHPQTGKHINVYWQWNRSINCVFSYNGLLHRNEQVLLIA